MFVEIYPKDDKGHYYTGLPCKWGHLTWRNKYGSCSECLRIKSRKRVWTIEDNVKRRLRGKFKTYRRRGIERKYLVLIRAAKRRAKNKGLEFNLTEEWAQKRWTGKCELTGIDFVSCNKKRHADYYSASIDRIDNTKGYTKDNSRFILYILNRFKGTLSDEEMYRIVFSLINNKNNTQTERAVASGHT